MSLVLAMTFAPSFGTVPAYLSRSAIAISPRFPRPGGSTGGQVIGTDGATTTYTPIRSALEAQAWGASVALWSYTDVAASYGYASPAQFVGEFTAAGIPIQGTTNTRAADPSVGPFMQDAGGSNWSAGSNPDRPALSSGQQNPLKSRIGITIDYMPAADAAVTQPAKLSAIASQMSAGCFGLHMDDPRGGMAYAGWRGAVSAYDITSQGCDFSPTARAGFTTWLGANTTAGQRTAVGLPSSLAGFDILAWLKANKSPVMIGAGQVDSNAVDNYLFRTSVSNDEVLRTIILNWLGRFLRDDHASYVQQVRTQLAGAPLSFNFWNASPSEYISWHARRSPQLWDFAVAETAPPYWSDLSSYTIGSAGYYAARETQQARQHMNAATCDWLGLRAFFEHKPTAPNAAPPRVLKQVLRQSLLQTIFEGHTPVVPADVFMTTNDGDNDQGVNVDGYRFWGSVADYGDVFTFLRANAASIDGLSKLSQVFVAVHTDTFPFQSGSQAARFKTVMGRLADLWRSNVDYHILPVGASDGLLPTDPVRSIETTAPLILRVQDDSDYYAHLGRLAGPKCRRWSSSAVADATALAPVHSSNPSVRVSAKYDTATRTVVVHCLNCAINADGTPQPQTFDLTWMWGYPTSSATVTRLGEAAGTAAFAGATASITLTEYALVRFTV